MAAPTITDVRTNFDPSYDETTVPDYFGANAHTGVEGWYVYVYGTNLDTVTLVVINGANCGTITHISPTVLKVYIPTGAGPNVGTTGWSYSPMFPPYGAFGTGGVLTVTNPDGSYDAPFVILFVGPWNQGPDQITSYGHAVGQAMAITGEMGPGGVGSTSEAAFITDIPPWYSDGTLLTAGVSGNPGAFMEFKVTADSLGNQIGFEANVEESVFTIDAYPIRANFSDPSPYPIPPDAYSFVEFADPLDIAPGQLVGTVTVDLPIVNAIAEIVSGDVDWTANSNAKLRFRPVSRTEVTSLDHGLDPHFARGVAGVSVFYPATESSSVMVLLAEVDGRPFVFSSSPARTATYTFDASNFSIDDLFVTLLTLGDYEDESYFGFGTAPAFGVMQRDFSVVLNGTSGLVTATIRPQQYRYTYLNPRPVGTGGWTVGALAIA